MPSTAKDLLANRANRNAAREVFDNRLAQVRSDLEARGIGGRIADRIGDEARDVFEEAVAIAEDNRGVMAGTLAALVLWLLRNPIIAWVDGLIEARHPIIAPPVVDTKDIPDERD